MTRAAPRPPAARGPDRRRTVLVTLASGAGALLAGTAVWVRAVTTSPVDGDVPVSVVGSVVAPGVNAGGLLALAAGLALALGGRWGSRLAGAGVVLAGLLVVASALGGLADPEAAASSAASQAVGVGTLTGDVEVGPQPWLAVGAGVLLVLTGLWALARAARWAAPAARHERPATAGGAPAATGAPVDGPAAPGAAAPGTTSPATPADDHDAWDSLTRGEDPT